MILNSDRLRHDEFGEAYNRVPANERSNLAEGTLWFNHLEIDNSHLADKYSGRRLYQYIEDDFILKMLLSLTSIF